MRNLGLNRCCIGYQAHLPAAHHSTRNPLRQGERGFRYLGYTLPGLEQRLQFISLGAVIEKGQGAAIKVKHSIDLADKQIQQTLEISRLRKELHEFCERRIVRCLELLVLSFHYCPQKIDP